MMNDREFREIVAKHEKKANEEGIKAQVEHSIEMFKESTAIEDFHGLFFALEKYLTMVKIAQEYGIDVREQEENLIEFTGRKAYGEVKR